MLRVVGKTDNWSAPRPTFVATRFPPCDEEAHDFPVYCERLSVFLELPEHGAVAELFPPPK